MKKTCEVMISTTIDQKETMVKAVGEWIETAETTEIFYKDNSSYTHICFTIDQISVTREGDYKMSLIFREGERTAGTLGILSNDGKIFIRTESCRQKHTSKGLMAHIVYTLEFSAGEQKTSVRIMAQKRGERF